MKFIPTLVTLQIVFSSVEQCDDKAKVFRECQENLCSSSHCSTPEGAITKWKTLFLSNITKLPQVNFHSH